LEESNEVYTSSTTVPEDKRWVDSLPGRTTQNGERPSKIGTGEVNESKK
jgi:hypothetical protein